MQGIIKELRYEFKYISISNMQMENKINCVTSTMYTQENLVV